MATVDSLKVKKSDSFSLTLKAIRKIEESAETKRIKPIKINGKKYIIFLTGP